VIDLKNHLRTLVLTSYLGLPLSEYIPTDFIYANKSELDRLAHGRVQYTIRYVVPYVWLPNHDVKGLALTNRLIIIPRNKKLVGLTNRDIPKNGLHSFSTRLSGARHFVECPWERHNGLNISCHASRSNWNFGIPWAGTTDREVFCDRLGNQSYFNSN
jgi:hypothetical protein